MSRGRWTRTARLRFASQSLFFLLSLGVFNAWISDRRVVAAFESMHVFPSLASLAFLSMPPCLAAFGAMLLLPLLAGRLYCSYLCPAGFLQDLARLAALRRGAAGRPAPDQTGLRVFVLALALGLTLSGSSAYHYFDHFSSMGRAFAAFRALAGLTPKGWSMGFGLAFLLLLLLVPPAFPRWFCSALCPSGTLFMTLQRFSRYKVRISEDCADCGLCAPACPALCIDDGQIDQRRCINCLECLPACGTGAISFSRAPREPMVPVDPEGRRRFLALGGLGLLALADGVLLKRRFDRVGFFGLRTVVPPGAKSGRQFLERCAACGACVAACPTKVIVQAGAEQSFLDLAKVRMDYDRSYCSYECNACLSVCPTEALSYFPLDAKRRIKVGSSRIDKGLCVPYAKKQDCAACHEACPTGTVVMVKRGEIFAPTLDDNYCIGCGACQLACPTRPVKAITVTPRDTHTVAYAARQSHRKKKPGPSPVPAKPEAFPF